MPLSAVESARREKLARILLVPLLVIVLLGAAASRWHSSTSVDNRTYLEMTQGVARHGLPYTENGPPASVARFPELRARWNRLEGGRLWGSLAPEFAYLALPAYLLGGAAGITRMNIALLAVLALGVFALGRRLTRDPLAGTGAAYITLVAAPVFSVSFDTSPYTFSITFLTWSAHLALCALDGDSSSRRTHWLAFGCGVLGGLSVGAHIAVFPMVASFVLLLGVLPGANDSPPEHVRWAVLEPYREWLPTRSGSLRRGAWAALGLVGPLLFMSVTNHVRFRMWNPISYGPCEWRSCVETGLDKQGIGAMIRYAAPVIGWAVVTLGALWAVRKSRVALSVVGLGGLLVLSPPNTMLHEHAMAIGAITWGFIVDVSELSMGHGFVRHADGLGNFLGPFAIKALLQGTPVLLLAPLAGAALPRERRAAILLVGIPCVAMFGALALRANLPVAFGLGFPFLNLRYVMPTVPLLAVLVVAALAGRSWRIGHTIAAICVAGAYGAWLVRFPDENSRALRIIVLRGTLACGALAFVLVANDHRDARRWIHRTALAAAAVAIGLGGAVTVGIDLLAMVKLRNEGDRHMEEVARLVPQRFALVGWPPDIDPVLALRTTRDIVYADLYESQNWANFRSLIDLWADEHRPIYALFPTTTVFNSPWHDVRFEIIDHRLGLYRLTRL